MFAPRFLFRTVALSAAMLPLWAGAAIADPPDRVGRLSVIEGNVSIHSAGDDQWQPAGPNYPISTGDTVWVEPGSRAEIEVGGTALRLDQETEADILRLEDNATVLRVDEGAANLRVYALPPGGLTVLTPNGQLSVNALGSYYVAATASRPGTPPDRIETAVLQGAARFNGPRGTMDLRPGESAISVGGNVSLAGIAQTPINDWGYARDRQAASQQAVQYVSPETTGYQDLDANGRWGNDPEYGTVWYPTTVAADWAPYRYGHWAFVRPWGWTWIDDASWGFAPFHYGRWVQIGPRWAWWPGERVARPVYAPALVVFLGGIGSGPSVGWIPLAPREPFRPYFTASANYERNVNRSSGARGDFSAANANANGSSFRNRGAVTVVPNAAFTRAQPVQRAAVAVDSNQVSQARVAPAAVSQLRPERPERSAGPGNGGAGNSGPGNNGGARPQFVPNQNGNAPANGREQQGGFRGNEQQRSIAPQSPSPQAAPNNAPAPFERRTPDAARPQQAPAAAPQVQAAPNAAAPNPEPRRFEQRNDPARQPQADAPPRNVQPNQAAPSPFERRAPDAAQQQPAAAQAAPNAEQQRRFERPPQSEPARQPPTQPQAEAPRPQRQERLPEARQPERPAAQPQQAAPARQAPPAREERREERKDPPAPAAAAPASPPSDPRRPPNGG